MGLGIGMSTDSYDKPLCTENYKSGPWNLPNPNPKKFTIKRSEQIGNFLIVEIIYDGCTNYEGRKILVYRGCTIQKLTSQKLIDPHFSENKNYISPFARFEPTVDGWNFAKILCKSSTF